MNKRKTKKFKKKLKQKKYLNSRRLKIQKWLYKEYKDIDPDALNIVYIVDSKKMNLKHPLKISLLKNCVPTRMVTVDTDNEMEVKMN